MKVVIYQQDDGKVAVLWPSDEFVEKYGIEAIAKKDVPAGVPYKIIDSSDLPFDRTFRDAWEVDASILTDGVGSESYEFENEVTQ